MDELGSLRRQLAAAELEKAAEWTLSGPTNCWMRLRGRCATLRALMAVVELARSRPVDGRRAGATGRCGRGDRRRGRKGDDE